MSRVIDAHQHVWGPATDAWLRGLPIDRAFDLDDFTAASAGLGIDGSVLVEVSSTDAETDLFLALKSQHPEVLGVVGWVDLTDPLLGHRLDEIGGDLNGIRAGVQDDPDGSWYHRADVRRGLGELERLDLAFDLLVRRPARIDAAILARETPGVRFVLDHAAKPEIDDGEWDDWLGHLRALADLGNVTCKLSGFVTEASWTGWRTQDVDRYFDAVLDTFGPERCMWGSDWPVSVLAATYAELFEFAQTRLAALSTDERAAVMGGTADRVYRL